MADRSSSAFEEDTMPDQARGERIAQLTQRQSTPQALIQEVRMVSRAQIDPVLHFRRGPTTVRVRAPTEPAHAV